MPAIDWNAVGFDPAKESAPTKKGAIDWEHINATHDAPIVATPELKPHPTGPVGFGDYAQGLGSGLNRGLAYLAGMPVDIAANAVDLAKAGIGYGTSKVTGHAPPEWTEPFDRTKVPGSGAWIADKMHHVAGQLYQVDANRPDDGLVRGLHNFGTAAPTGLIAGPAGIARAASAMVGAGLPNVLAGKIAEAYPDEPGWSALASQVAYGAPTIAGKVGANAAAAMAGGREGIKQRIATANQAGNVPLTVGQATGIPALQGIENVGVKAPFGGGTYKQFAKNQSQAMQNGLENVALQIDPQRATSNLPTIERAGIKVKSGLQGPYYEKDALGNNVDTSFKNQVAQAEKTAFQDVSAKVPMDYRTSAPNAVAQAKRVLNPAPQDAAEVNDYLAASGVREPANAIIAGANGAPAVAASGNKAAQAAMPPGLTFQALWNLRQQLGEDAFSSQPGIFAPRAKSPLQSMYGPLTTDLGDVAAFHNATPEWAGYQSLVKNNRNLSDSVESYATQNSPEAAFKMAERDFQNTPSSYRALSTALPITANDAVAAEIVSRLGKASPSLQGKDAETFNNSNFLTNAAKKRQNDPNAFDNLFQNTSAPTAADQFNALLDTSGLIKDSQGWLNNTSQTAPVGAAMGAVSGMASGVADGNLGLLGKIMGGATVAAQVPRVMTSQNVVHAIANGVEMTPLQRAIGMALQSGAPIQYPAEPPANSYDAWPY